jgi:hypothetical protein
MSEPEPIADATPPAAKSPSAIRALWNRLPTAARIAVPLVALAILGGIAAAVARGVGPTRFEAAAADCGLEDSVVGDGGKSLYLDMEGEELLSGELDYFEILCVLEEVHVPDYVLDHMGSTRSLDGRQSDEWDGIEASWTYHPDDGLDVLLVLE